MRSHQEKIVHPHIEALIAKHDTKSRQIREATQHLSMDEGTLRQWKIERLRLKDEIAAQRRAAH